DGISRSLQDCTMTHGERCAEMSLPRNINLRCIDCEGMKVVDLPSNSRYLALSYVWGACSNVEKEANLSDVPAVIKDAIFVTLQLSFRFLWIDRYCIDQNDDMEKHNQIANMGSIYAGATMTIIAAGGTDAHSGLPGASSCHCDLDEGFQLGTYSLIPVLGNPKEALNRSKWSTRGW
ncbi:HET-domain-containing protein, partial [Lophiostoma macrostomum CBS 122681]